MSGPNVLDPRLFDPAAIDAETAAFNQQLEQTLAATRPLQSLEPQAIRDATAAGRGLFGAGVESALAVERSIPGRAGTVLARVFVPETVEGVYVHIHGGGFMLGRAQSSDQRNEAIARGCNLAVISIDYRLAPENPYPAGSDDCEDVAHWLSAHAEAEFGSARLLIGGESAGANLAVVTLVRMRDRHGFRGWAGANLVYGGYDLMLSPSARNWGERYLVLSTPIIRWFHEHYAPPERWSDPDLSPIYADLHDLPPALFSVGTLDPLLDDSLFMYSRWLAAGNEAELAVYPGGVHMFDTFPIELARRATGRIDTFLRRMAPPNS